MSHLIMMRHRVFSTVSGSPLLFWIFRMSASKEEERRTMMVRERVMSIVLRERERRARRSQTVVFGAFRLSHFFKNRTTTQSFSDPHVMRARAREETSPRERERERERVERKEIGRRRRLLRWSRAFKTRTRTAKGPPFRSRRKGKIHTQERAIRENETFSFATHTTRTGYLQHRLKRRRVGPLFHQTRERVCGQTRVTSGGRCCCHLTLVRRKALRELCDDANAMRRKKA